jgi:hypothetical protein
MKTSMLTVAVFVISGWSQADTITLQNHAVLNGFVTYASDTFSIEASYPSQGTTPVVKTYDIPRLYVDTVEFNSTTMNPGAPPKRFIDMYPQLTATGIQENGPMTSSSGSQRTTVAKDEQSSLSMPKDTIRLLNGTEKHGQLISVTSNELVFEDTSAPDSVQRRQVLSIVLGGQPTSVIQPKLGPSARQRKSETH